MIMVQRFHSIHEIDPEFIPNIEVLLQEDIASFDILVERHDSAPTGHAFTYFLFFGPTQNTPIGFAQLCLRPTPSDQLRAWYKKLAFWEKAHLSWKQLSWKIGDGSAGVCAFDPKYFRSGKDKIQELVREYEERPEVVSQEVNSIKGLQEFSSTWTPEHTHTSEAYVLEGLSKASKTYQDYLTGLATQVREDIRKGWKELHVKGQISLGDYQSPADVPKSLPIPVAQLEAWTRWGAQVLTFEREGMILGCLLVLRGKNGNVFFEPFPFEPVGESLVSDELYTQYAILKFFEMPEARRCHLMKFGSKLVFEDKEDLKFFLSQGFQQKTVVRHFQSRLRELNRPL